MQVAGPLPPRTAPCSCSERAAVQGKGSKTPRLPPNLTHPNAHHGPRGPPRKSNFLTVKTGNAPGGGQVLNVWTNVCKELPR